MKKMTKVKSLLSVYVAIMLVLGGFATQISAQQKRNEREVRNIVKNLNSKIDDFKYSLRYGLQNSRVDRQNGEAAQNDLNLLDDKVTAFEGNLDQRRENSDDVVEIYKAAQPLNQFMQGNRVSNTAEKDWSNVRENIQKLAAVYQVSWDWTYGSQTSNNSDYNRNANNNQLNGTYQIDVSKSENTIDIVDNSDVQTDDQRRDLESKLEAADQVAIEIRGTQVIIGSSKAAPVTFAADGQTRTENSNGRTIRTRASLRGGELTVSSLGGESDYTINFVSQENGRAMKVTRRITTAYLNQTVFADSYYTKTDEIARFDGTTNQDQNNSDNTSDNNSSDNNNDGNYSSNDPNDNPNNNPNSNNPNTSNNRSGNFIVPNGTTLTGILENDVTTKISQNNDRFRMTVQSPNEYRGAVVEGYISGVNRSGKVSGRSQITFNFEKITLRNGQSYDFAGNLQSVTDTNGKIIKVDNEGTTKGDSQTKETVKRGGIGAGAGALIGAIIGGAKGAAIGAIIGGGAGAGSVIAQGKDDLDLKKGSTMTIQASSPNR